MTDVFAEIRDILVFAHDGRKASLGMFSAGRGSRRRQYRLLRIRLGL